jgi:cytochrome c biogenesis protein CcdA
MGGPGSAFGAFVVAGLVLVVMFIGLSLVIGSAQERTVKRIQARSTEVKRWGGWILVAIGTWFVSLAIWADFFAKLFPV